MNRAAVDGWGVLLVWALTALISLLFVLDRVSATPRARAVRVSRRLDEARRLVRPDDRN